jgi:hypothetical protein
MLIAWVFGFISDINAVLQSGFAKSNEKNMMVLGFMGFFIGMSLVMPALRRMYYKLPWLFPLVKILYLDVIILGVAAMIINYGYEVQDKTRHTVFFFIMLGEIIAGRLLMCRWFDKKKVKYVGSDYSAE